MPFDPNLELIPKTDLIDTNRNWYHKGNIYHPDVIPARWRTEEYCENPIVKDADEFSPIAGANIPETIELTMPTDKIGLPIDYDKIDINSCTVEQLMAIEGFPNQAANRILSDREAKGKYDSIKALVDRLPSLAKHVNTLEARLSFDAS